MDTSKGQGQEELNLVDKYLISELGLNELDHRYLEKSVLLKIPDKIITFFKIHIKIRNKPFYKTIFC
ncbi:MAG: hypothetical protein ACFFHD_14080 [Promethearchaeota archaeon]